MTLSYRRFFFFFFFLSLVIANAFTFLGEISTARADESASASSILLLVHGDDLPKERLRDAIAKELGKNVTLSGAAAGGVVTVTYRQAARELAVTWDGPKRGTVSRVVSAPNRIDDVVRDAAMLAGNLARDEAEDLIAPPPPPPAPPPLPPPTQEAPPLPAPSTTPTTAPEPPRTWSTKDKDEVALSVFYPLATNLNRPWVKANISFNLLYGRIGQLDGFQLGVINVVTPGSGKGTGDVSGVELGVGANIATGKVEGLQLSPFVNIAGNGIEGWQTSFVLNRSGGKVDGVQIAWGINSASGTVSGLQLAALNVAGDVRGAQFGLINVGKKVDGTMIGLVNVADDIDGVPIGIASVTKTGGVHPQAWVSSASIGNIGIKLATKHTYTMPSGHFHHAYDRDFLGAGFTIGGHIPIGDNNLGPYVDTDLSFAWLYAPKRSAAADPTTGAVDTYHEHLIQPRIRAIFGWRFVDHFGLFGGVGLLTQVRVIRDGKESIIRLGPEFVVGVEL